MYSLSHCDYVELAVTHFLYLINNKTCIIKISLWNYKTVRHSITCRGLREFPYLTSVLLLYVCCLCKYTLNLGSMHLKLILCVRRDSLRVYCSLARSKKLSYPMYGSKSRSHTHTLASLSILTMENPHLLRSYTDCTCSYKPQNT